MDHPDLTDVMCPHQAAAMGHEAPSVSAAKGSPRLYEQRALFHWVRTFFDVYDLAERGAEGWRQNPLATLERHLQLRHEQGFGFLRPLRSQDLKRHRLGLGTFGLRPRRVENELKTELRVLIRIDVDEHDQAQTDGHELVQWIRRQRGFGRLYVERSPRGWSGYTAVVCPLTYYTVKGERRPAPSKSQINHWLDQYEVALRHLAQRRGFRAGVEVSGRLATYRWDEDTGDCSVGPGDRGRFLRLPRCRAKGNVAKLVSSETSVAAVHNLIRSALPAWTPLQLALLEPAPPSQKPRNTRKEAAAARKLVRILGTACGSKWSNSIKSVGTALRVLGDRATDEAVVDRANEIYEASGFADGTRDADRDGRFAEALAWCRGPGARQGVAGDDPLWFDGEDLVYLGARIASAVPNARLDEINESNKAALDGGRLTHGALALVACTVVKNAMTNENEVPATAVVGMLKHFGIRANGTFNRLAREVLCEIGLIECATRSYAPGRKCRKWRPAGAALMTPFIADAEELEEARRVYADRRRAKQDAEAHGRAGGEVRKFPTSILANPTSDEMIELTHPDIFSGAEVIWEPECEDFSPRAA